MNIPHTWSNVGRLTPNLLKFTSIVLLGTSVGILSTMYSPLFALSGTAVFTILAISLYISSHYQHTYTVADRVALSAATESKDGLLFHLFYLSFFLSITIPKSGRTISGIPITTANILILFTLACWVIKFIFSRNTTFSIPLFSSIIFFMLYGLGAFLIGLINKNPRKFVILDLMAFIGFIPVYFLVCSAVHTRNQIKKIVWAIVISSIAVCTYGVLQTKIGFERMAIPGITQQYEMTVYQGVGRWNVIEGGARKVYSTFQNGNIFGNHLATFIPFLGGILIGLPSSKKKILVLGIFLLACYVLILTYSRGALVGAFGGIMVLAVISKKIRLKAIIVVILIFSVLFVFMYLYSDRPELARYDFRRMTTNPDRFSAGRLERAKQAIAGFSNLPLTAKLFGVGFGGILISPLGWRFEYVDNLYLTLLFKMGAIGLAILIGVLLYLFITILKLRSRTPDLYLKGLINGGIAGLAGSLVHNLADTLWFFPPLSANFWFLAGITISFAAIGSRNFESDKQVSERPQKTEVTQLR